MERSELDELKEKVCCAAVLEREGFALDVKESTRKAMKYRRDTAIIIVIHEGKGWFDPLSDGKGDIFNLVEHLKHVPFIEAMHHVAELVGFVPSQRVWQREARDREPDLSIAERWQARRKPWRGSATWRYLRDTRHLPETVIRTAIAAGLMREGPHGSMWAAHSDAGGAVTGWEERGPDWRGFATGGAKDLFRFGRADASRLCVTEAAIDAMSLAALEGLRADTLYLSTGGGWSSATAEAIVGIAAMPGAHLVAATDNNVQGETYAGRLFAIAEATGCGVERLRPALDDWNAVVDAATRAGRGKDRGTGGVPHARRPPQG
jgi:hypothetical protein